MEDNFNRWVGKQSKQTHAQQYPPQSSTPQSAQTSPTSMHGLSQPRRTLQQAPPPPDPPPSHNMPPTDPPLSLNSLRTETPPLFNPPQTGEIPPNHASSNETPLCNRQQDSPPTDLQLSHNSPPTDPPPSHHLPRTVTPPLPNPLRTGDIPPNRAFSNETPLQHNSHRTETAATHDSPQIRNPPVNGSPQIWTPPAKGVLKVNVDGSFLPETGEAAVACVCRDNRGVLIDGFVRTVRVSSALQAEAQALLQTLKYFEGKEEKEIEVESDSLELVKSLEESTPVSWGLDMLFSELQARVKSFTRLKIKHCQRECNTIVDWVCKAHRRKALPTNWVYYPPSCLLVLLCTEASLI